MSGATRPELRLLLLDHEGRMRETVAADPAAPALSAVDLAATRGDGVFETISIARGRPQALDAHLDRFAASARMLDLPTPDRAAWHAVVLDVAGALGDADEAWVKIVLSRGVEFPVGRAASAADAAPTGWAWGDVSPDHRHARTEGIAVAVLDRGIPADTAAMPWLLAGAKTLSYAVNMAAKREAARRGADDVVFASSDGVLLEGPTSTLVILRDGGLVTPSRELGILAGTSQADLFRWAEQRGMPTSEERMPRSALETADAAWLVSSVRHAAPIREVDGAELHVDRETSEAMNGFLIARTE